MSDYFNSVEKALHKYYGNQIKLYESDRKDKKFMIYDLNGRKIHFGARGYLDYHLDNSDFINERRRRFRNRNHKWAFSDKYTPSHLAYYVLW